ncbi:MAG: DUF1080 domain-containing protein [Opitutus sp.]|nr:DUF1080 domain-containing protein [Opitutus sp.]
MTMSPILHLRRFRWRSRSPSRFPRPCAPIVSYPMKFIVHPMIFSHARAVFAALACWLVGQILPAAEEREAGFMSLFNGKDLTGWDGMPGAWRVKDGAICSGGTTKNWLIWRGGEVDDFELRLRFRYTKGNSGVQVRSEDKGKWQVHGYQVEVAAKSAMGLWHESLWTEQERRFLSTAGQKVRIAPDGTRNVEQVADPATVQSAFKENDWNDLVVIGTGSRLVQIINGVVFSDLIDQDRTRSRISGVIAFQDHGGGCVAEFKDIRLKRIPPK